MGDATNLLFISCAFLSFRLIRTDQVSCAAIEIREQCKAHTISEGSIKTNINAKKSIKGEHTKKNNIILYGCETMFDICMF